MRLYRQLCAGHCGQLACTGLLVDEEHEAEQPEVLDDAQVPRRQRSDRHAGHAAADVRPAVSVGKGTRGAYDKVPETVLSDPSVLAGFRTRLRLRDGGDGGRTISGDYEAIFLPKSKPRKLYRTCFGFVLGSNSKAPKYTSITVYYEVQT